MRFLFVCFAAGFCFAASPVDAQTFSPSERQQLVESLRALENGQKRKARDIARRLQSPLAEDIFRWYALRVQPPEDDRYAALSAFINRRADWPGTDALSGRMERLLPVNVGADGIIAMFENARPETPEGMDAYLHALAGKGQVAKARSALRNWWTRALMEPEQQDLFLNKYGAYLDRQTHVDRLNRLLYARHYTNARQIAALLGNGYPELAEARIALANNKDGVNALINRVPAHLQNDPGLRYERLRWRRRHDLNDRAIELLRDAPDMSDVPNASAWWLERHIIVRRFIEDKAYVRAYELASSHRQKDGLPFAQAEWLSGWLALRKLGKPYEAFQHFEKLYRNVSSPISRARGAYWAGLAAETLRQGDVANAWFMSAAAHDETFYGQMAIMALKGRKPADKAIRPQINDQMRGAYRAQDMAVAAQILSAAGLREEASRFFSALSYKAKSPEEYALLAELAEAAGHRHDALRIAKRALRKDIDLREFAYPDMRSEMRGVKTDFALVHALMRQESAFDAKARSHAGALGLMQLMPATASETARELGLSHRKDWLTEKPSYNIQLGTAYLEKMLDRFNGSYALALAAYNAGPGRVPGWIADYGDPRTGEINEMDWIESIPIYETRNYVQRVLEAAYVYRDMFGYNHPPVSATRLYAQDVNAYGYNP